MRPGDYAHEKWPELSRQIKGIKQMAKNQYYVIHKFPNLEHTRVICLTKTQVDVYETIRDNEDMTSTGCCKIVDVVTQNNVRSVAAMINKGFFVQSGQWLIAN